MDKLKKRWGITSSFQLIIILLVFSATGSLTLVVKSYFFDVIGITSDTPLYILIPLYIISIIPIYWILLLILGSILGQHKFFLAFGKKSISRFKRKK